MTATVGVTADLSARRRGEEPVTIPAHAVFSDPEGGANVWVVDESSLTVHRRPVSAGPVTGSDGIIILDVSPRASASSRPVSSPCVRARRSA